MPHSLVPASSALAFRPGTGSLSEPMRELMTRPPHWLLRSGATILGCALVLLLALSALISYPDMLTSRLTVTGTNAVVEVMARQAGHLKNLRVQEKQMVTAGEILAIIDNPSDPPAVFAFRQGLEQLSAMLVSDTAFVETTFPQDPKLGRLQDSASTFLAAYARLLNVWKDDHATTTSALLSTQLAHKLTQVENMQGQLKLMDQEAQLAQEKYDRMKVLFARGTISSSQLNEHQTQLLIQTREHSSVSKSFLEEQILASRLDKELRDLQHERTEALQVARDHFRTAYQKLHGEIDLWESDYVLKAPSAGMVAFYDFWSAEQYVTAGRQVFLIIPATASLRGRLTISQGGAGKIKPGQLVRIKFDDYPSKDFGIVTGRVQSVSLVAREGSNQVLVDLDYPLISSYHKELHFKQEMAGEGSIITENTSVLGRIFYEIRQAFDQSTTP